MKFHPDFEEFLQGWQEKASRIDTDALAGLYDKFTTLFVVYNRLYAMATFCLWSKKQVRLPSGNYFPDNKASSQYLARFLGPAKLMEEFNHDPSSRQAIDTIKDHIRTQRFYFKLKLPYADPDPNRDRSLLHGLGIFISRHTGKFPSQDYPLRPLQLVPRQQELLQNST